MQHILLVVGLGNPGERYADTRHNVGHHVVHAVAQRMNATMKRHRAGARVAEGRIGVGADAPRCIVATLDTYMNTSGGPTAALCSYYDIDPSHDLLVVHDDLDIEAMVLRLKRGGGEGGHNGLRSISQSTKTRDYARLRVGIGRPPGRQDPADYVLSSFPRKEREDWDITWSRAVDAIEDVATMGFLAAQQRLHSLGK